MRKTKIVILAAALAMTAGLWGCGGQETVPETAGTEAAVKTEEEPSSQPAKEEETETGTPDG